MAQMVGLTIGADPEFFLRKGKRNVSAHGLIPGDKVNPHKLKDGACQLDGTAVEFNIDPCKNAMDFNRSVREVLKQIRKMVPKEYAFDFSPSVKYTPKYFKNLPPEVKLLGCNPDHDAYKKGRKNKMPKNVGTMRTGAGHIHFGFVKDAQVDDPNHIMDCIMLVRNVDALVGVIEHNWDNDNDRRKMYGKLGCFRPKTYGVEYRSLSNAWVKHPELYQFIFELMQYAFYATMRGVNLKERIPQEKMGVYTWNVVSQALPGLRYPVDGLFHKLPAFPGLFEAVKEKKNGTRVRKSRGRG